MAIQVLVADDRRVLRQGPRRFLESDPEREIVGEARDGAEALSLARQLRTGSPKLATASPAKPLGKTGHPRIGGAAGSQRDSRPLDVQEKGSQDRFRHPVGRAQGLAELLQQTQRVEIHLIVGRPGVDQTEDAGGQNL
jgi:CheY-like chemotaxis protein